MRNTFRLLFSALTGPGIALFTVISAFTAGVIAPATVGGFLLLAVYGLIEIAIQSYAPPRERLRARPLPTVPTRARVSTVAIRTGRRRARAFADLRRAA